MKSVSAVDGEFREKILGWIEQGKEAPHAVFLDIGTLEAKVLLSFSRGNRNIRPHDVAKYSRDATAGRWSLTHQGGGFDVTGKLIDFHHRALAIIDANKHLNEYAGNEVRITAMFTFGLPVEASACVDEGIRRTPQDQFFLGFGRKISRDTVAIVRMALRLEAKRINNFVVSTHELADAIDRYEDAMNALSEAFRSRFPAGVWGVIVFMYVVDPELITNFALSVARGTDLRAKSPALTLREWLRDAPTHGNKHGMNIAIHTLYAIRAELEGRELSKFAVKRDEHDRTRREIIEWAAKQVAKASA